MEEIICLYPLLSLLFILMIIMKLLVQRNKTSLNIPPSPPSLPLIGHLHLFKKPFHETMQKISTKYGPIISLKCGGRLAILVTSPSAVEECFIKNDIVFADRPPLLIGKYLGYNYNSMVTASYGEHWRNLRKVSLLELFSKNRLSMSVGIRKDEIKRMLSKLLHDSLSIGGGYAKVELKSVIRGLVLNMLLRMLVGKRYYGGEGRVMDSEEARQFTDIITEALELFVTLDPGDIIPVLRWIDYGGFLKRNKILAKKADEFLQGLIDEHRREVPVLNNAEDQDEQQPMIKRLLSLQKSDPECYTDETIKGLIFVLLVAGTDTSSTTMECAMLELLKNPNVMNKARSELEIQIGKDSLIDELDLPKLPYLQNVILETLRMYPPVPFLLPHLSSQDCQIGGFDVPCGTILLVNAWAIHHDPNLWDEPTEFKPERFQTTNNNGDHINGDEHYKLLPFGAGRRACPGTIMGKRMVGCVLGSLIQCFDWKQVTDEAQPVEAMCKPRLFINKILSMDVN